jgi:hypothetical protein
MASAQRARRRVSSDASERPVLRFEDYHEQEWLGTKVQLQQMGIELHGSWPTEPSSDTRLWAKALDCKGRPVTIVPHGVLPVHGCATHFLARIHLTECARQTQDENRLPSPWRPGEIADHIGKGVQGHVQLEVDGMRIVDAGTRRYWYARSVATGKFEGVYEDDLRNLDGSVRVDVAFQAFLANLVTGIGSEQDQQPVRAKRRKPRKP